jgi:hypothetical protein
MVEFVAESPHFGETSFRVSNAKLKLLSLKDFKSGNTIDIQWIPFKTRFTGKRVDAFHILTLPMRSERIHSPAIT